MSLRTWARRAAEDDDLITYQLHIVLARSQWIGIGRLGRFQFPAGRYLYTGSARRNLTARVRRHLAKQKTLRWHIDYLLAKPQARVTTVELFAEGECRCNQQVNGELIVPGFGASDCRAGCGSHLKYLGPYETDTESS
jgi:Uri superfamily endonuclease